jgi:hypothetical protein
VAHDVTMKRHDNDVATKEEHLLRIDTSEKCAAARKCKVNGAANGCNGAANGCNGAANGCNGAGLARCRCHKTLSYVTKGDAK